MKLIDRERDLNNPGILRLVVELEQSWLDLLFSKPPVQASFVGGGEIWRDESTGTRPSKSLEKKLRALNAEFEKKRLKKLIPPGSKNKRKL